MTPRSADCSALDGSGLVTDNATRLTWTSIPYYGPVGQRTQPAAEAYCAGRGMRLPTKDEALGVAGTSFEACAFCSWFTWTSTFEGARAWRVTANGGAGLWDVAGDGNDRALCVK